MTLVAIRFLRRYTLPTSASTTFLCRFMTNSMYKAYYAWLNREFTKYKRDYAQALKKGERAWMHMNKKKHNTHANWNRRAA